MPEAEIHITFVPAPDDPEVSSPEYQAEQAAFVQALRSENINPRSSVFIRDALPEGVEVGTMTFLGKHVLPLVPDALKIGAGALIAWITARAGRKVRLKVGDVEAEAQTPKDIEKLFQQAAQFKKDQDANKGSDE